MNHTTLVKVYGHIYPVKPLKDELLQALASLVQDALPSPEDPVLSQDGDMLRISFEGIYFPLDEVLQTMTRHLTENSRGKLDYIDLEAWTLHRITFEGLTLHSSRAPLNNVLAYSGH